MSCGARMPRQVDFSLLKPFDQVGGRQVDDFDVLGQIKHAVGHSLAYQGPCGLGDDLIETFDVLDIQRGENIDARFDQLLDIEIALGISRARHVAVRQLVDDDEIRPPFEKRVEIHLFERMLLLLDRFARDYLKPAQLFFGILPAVRFDQTDHDVGAVVASGLRGLQHFIGFPDTGGGAQEYLQAAVAHFTGITHSFVTRLLS